MSCTYNTEINKYITVVCTKIWATHFLTIFFLNPKLKFFTFFVDENNDLVKKELIIVSNKRSKRSIYIIM